MQGMRPVFVNDTVALDGADQAAGHIGSLLDKLAEEFVGYIADYSSTHSWSLL